MKDKLIDSWAPLELKKKLLEKERSLNEIIELCQVHEQIRNQSKTMNITDNESSTSSTPVNKMSLQKNNTHERCTRCGSQDHLANASDCPARNAKCRKCGLQGHFAFYCKTRQPKRPAPYRVTDNRQNVSNPE